MTESRLNRADAEPRRVVGLMALVASAGLCLSASAQEGVVEGDEAGEIVERPGEEQPDIADSQTDGVVFSATSEPVELIDLVNFVAEELKINVSVKGSISGTVMFNAQQTVPRDRLLPMLEALLDQYNYALTLDPVGIYRIQPNTEVPRAFEGEFATTKIIGTPNVRPSSLRGVLEPQSGGDPSARSSFAYVDDLGIIVVTDTPRKVRAAEELIGRILAEFARVGYTRIELTHVSATAARDRAIELVGQGDRLNALNLQGGDGQVQIPGQATGLDNIADRLTVDPASNALIFRGLEVEAEQVREVLKIIDVPTTLTPREFFAGAAATTIADIASRRGLGEVIKLDDAAATSLDQPFFVPGNRQQNFQDGSFGQTQALGGGSIMMVDEARGMILYYGTIEQQGQLEKLIDALKTGLDVIEIREYRVRNVQAKDLADLLQALIGGTSAGSSSPLLPGARGDTQDQAAGGGALRRLLEAQAAEQGQTIEGFTASSDEAFVTAFEATNTVLVKAPVKVQEQFARLIEKLDVRRAQVYIEAQIVAVSNTKDFRLAVEGQLQAGQFQTSTAFGLGSFGTGGAFTDPKLPVTTLSGLTSALIKSEYVPFIINAIQRDTDARILSTPQILVNDNTEASINSIEEQPTSTTTVGQTSDQTTFNGYESAGTSLTVTPSIAEAGYLRLNYEIELSNFVGAGTGGLPAPKNTRNVASESVTIPTDTTIVVGGITVSDTRKTKIKVPGLGDIPLIGLLFSDNNKVNNESVLYVFITPRILNDRNFADLRLLTRGPQSTAGIDPDLPDLSPAIIDIIHPGTGDDSPGEALPAIDGPTLIPLVEEEPDDAGVVRRENAGGENR